MWWCAGIRCFGWVLGARASLRLVRLQLKFMEGLLIFELPGFRFDWAFLEGVEFNGPRRVRLCFMVLFAF